MTEQHKTMLRLPNGLLFLILCMHKTVVVRIQNPNSKFLLILDCPELPMDRVSHYALVCIGIVRQFGVKQVIVIWGLERGIMMVTSKETVIMNDSYDPTLAAGQALGPPLYCHGRPMSSTAHRYSSGSLLFSFSTISTQGC